MSRQLEAAQEIKTAKYRSGVFEAIEYGLEGAVASAGGTLRGFSFKYGDADCLLTLRVILAGRAQISFVGGQDLGHCLTKAVMLARQDKLVWKDDKWAQQ